MAEHGASLSDSADSVKNDGQGSNRVSAQQRAYEHLKEQITLGSFAGGGFFTESVIAADLGMSRTPVREALFRLNVENLVRLIPGRGAFVPEITERTIREVMEVRVIIETYAVTKIGCPVPDGLLSELDVQLEQQQRTEGEPADFIRLDRSFHQTIVDACGSSLITDIYGSMRDQQMRMGVHAVVKHEGRFEAVMHEHHAIVDALRTDQVAGAVDAVRGHLRNTLEALLDRERL
jgi:DNA-binding GntR family transcriptional regulator